MEPPPKKSLYFWKQDFLICQEIENLKTFYISESNFSRLKSEKKLL